MRLYLHDVCPSSPEAHSLAFVSQPCISILSICLYLHYVCPPSPKTRSTFHSNIHLCTTTYILLINVNIKKKKKRADAESAISTSDMLTGLNCLADVSSEEANNFFSADDFFNNFEPRGDDFGLDLDIAGVRNSFLAQTGESSSSGSSVNRVFNGQQAEVAQPAPAHGQPPPPPPQQSAARDHEIIIIDDD